MKRPEPINNLQILHFKHSCVTFDLNQFIIKIQIQKTHLNFKMKYIYKGSILIPPPPRPNVKFAFMHGKIS